jgi:hypothetical protein
MGVYDSKVGDQQLSIQASLSTITKKNTVMGDHNTNKQAEQQ